MPKRQQDLQTNEAKNKIQCLEPTPIDFQPYQIGGFSSNEKYIVKNDDSEMKFLAIPKCTIKEAETGKIWSGLNMNLNENFENFKGDYNEKITSFVKLLFFICSRKVSQEGNFKNLFHLPNLSTEGSSDSSKNYFVCTREVLVFIFSSKYKEKTDAVNPEREKDFLICATKFQGVIYLSKVPTEKNTEGKENIDKAKEKEKNESDDGLKKIIYYGHKFEHNITRLKQGTSDPDSKIPNLNKQFYAVMNAQFAKYYHLIFSAQMDAVDHLSTAIGPVKHSFVEIKTNFELNSPKRIKKFKWKLLSWYLQSFIAGVPRLICGFRNNDGIVKIVKDYKVSDLPGIAAKLNTEKDIWSPDECLKSGADFLKRMKQVVVEDDPKTVHTFSLKPGETEIEIKCEEVGNPFLPDCYISKMLQLYELQCPASFPYSFL